MLAKTVLRKEAAFRHLYETYCFCPFLFSFNLVLIFILFLSQTEGSESFMLMFNKGSIEGTNS